MKHGIIYRATSPSGGVYIGKTRRSLTARIRGHKAKRGDCPAIYAAIKKYGAAIEWRVIAVVGVDFLNDVERFYIADYRAKGFALYNETDGGDGGAVTAAGRAKISAAHKGRPKTPAHRLALSEALLGKAKTPEHRAAISRARTGKPAHNKGKKTPAAARAKQSAAHLGKKHTAETKAKISATHKGRPHSPRHRENLAAANRRRAGKKK